MAKQKKQTASSGVDKKTASAAKGAAAVDLRGKTNDQLHDMLLSLRKDLLNLRFKVASEGLNDTSQFGKNKRQIARIKTVLRERQTSLTSKP